LIKIPLTERFQIGEESAHSFRRIVKQTHSLIIRVDPVIEDNMSQIGCIFLVVPVAVYVTDGREDDGWKCKQLDFLGSSLN
jgi:hypothetical protein